MNHEEHLVDYKEIDRFDQALQSYFSGEMDADRFQAVRLQQGVYGQRQDGVNMVRIKVPGGQLTPVQLTAVAEALENYAPKHKVHITTRQDIQMHYVPLEDTPAVLRRLTQAGLTTREACGNTVRNVTVCPLAGVCPREHVDVAPFLQGVVGHFLRHPLTQNLPRKFKISLSGCEADCAQGLMHDLAVVAIRTVDGRFGFKVLAGGGLGHKPHEAIVVEPFIEEKDLLPVMEAIVVLHNRYSDRAKRAKSRIKFLVDRFGAEGFVTRYREELSRTRAALAAHPYPKGQWQGGESGDAPGPGAPRRLFKQKQPGLYVFPVSVPLGGLDAEQLRGIAALMEDLGLSDVRTTQDQNLMLVNVPEPLLSAVSARLGALRLQAPRPGDDVVACPGTSTCRLGITSSQNLPRKFKISLSGCEADCAQGLMHDLAVVAIRTVDGRFGFKVLAGGGLGHKPHEAIVVEPFIEEKDLLPVMEAIVVLHNRYSDRAKRAKSRIKFLVDRFGAEGFVTRYREELSRTRAALAAHPYPKGQWQGGESGDAPGPGAPRRLFKQKQPGLYVFPVSVPLGGLDAEQLRGIAALMEDLGLSDVRTTQDQNLMLVNVPEPLLSAVSARLGALRLQAPRPGDDVVACPGTSTCRLGITSSMTVAPKLVGGKRNLRIRVSGCHNGCAQPETGDIGIFGEGRRMHGKLIPHYQMYFGGNGCGGGGLAIKGPSVPAARIEKAVERLREAYASADEPWESFFHWVRKQERGYFDQLLADLVHVSEADLQQVARDHGHRVEFKVLQLGGGECAGAVQNLVAAKFSEAAYERDCRNAFAAQRKHEEALDCAGAMARLVGQALLFLAGQDHKVDELSDVAWRLRDERSAYHLLGERLALLVGRLAELRASFDDAAFADVVTEIDAWVKEAEQACALADPRLNQPGVSSRPRLGASGVAASVDVSEHPCPINFLKAKQALDKLATGAAVEAGWRSKGRRCRRPVSRKRWNGCGKPTRAPTNPGSRSSIG
ncbi:MAG: nitrite/sulfite reductase [Gammaproteobacteria bacterium]|nr:nitrite/sulfite reductase [Gammaproteobacteria bacterium]